MRLPERDVESADRAAFFITRKTVETHLGAELAAILGVTHR
jgi:hypothetical protein